MKKVYQKPEIMFDDFSLSTNIAGDCEPPFVGAHSQGSCGVETSAGFTVFTADIPAVCTFPWDELEAGPYNGLCYDNPSNTNNLFNS